MAFKTGNRTVHNVGGIRGLAVKFVGADETKRALALLPAAVQRRVLRNAVAAAARPVTKAMRAGARTAASQSRRREGIGTTARSIVQKVATSKRDPSVAYAVIGARRGYSEMVSLVDETKRSAVKNIRVRRQTKRGRRGTTKVTERDLKNLGSVARKARLNPKSNSTHKRVPSRYLHLIEKGTKRSRGYGFMQSAAGGQISAVRDAFARVLDEGLIREFNRMAAK